MRPAHLIILFFCVGLLFSRITYEYQIGGDRDIFSEPVNVLYHGGYIYVSDMGSQEVIKIEVINSTEYDVVKHITAKDEDDGLSGPRGLFWKNDTLYVADEYGDTVWMYNKRSYLYEYLTLVNSPVDVLFDGDITYVLSRKKSRVYVYNGTQFLDYIGREGEFDLMFNHPEGFSQDEDKLYIADTQNNRIEVIYKNGSMDRYIGKKNTSLNHPEGVFYYNGYVFVADTRNDRIVVFDMFGNYYESYDCWDCPNEDQDEDEEENLTFDRPTDVYVEDDKVYVADSGNDRIVVLSFEPNYNYTEDELEVIQQSMMNLEEYDRLYNLADGWSLLTDEDITHHDEIEKTYETAESYEEDGYYPLAYKSYFAGSHECVNAANMLIDKIKKYLSNLINNKSNEADLTDCKTLLSLGKYNETYYCVMNVSINKTEEEHTNMSDEIKEINNSLSTLRELSDRCKVNISGIEDEYTVLISYYEAGDYDNAESILNRLKTDITNKLKETEDYCNRIELIKQRLSVLRNNTYDPKITKQLERIEEIMYDDPAGAEELLSELEDMNERQVNHTDWGLIAFVIVIILIGILLTFGRMKINRFIWKMRGGHI